jgi:bifunctional DNA-binding transcriptional regulator/antitoxin component of YhaV-PrlF toxin-antitoxin module
VTIPAPLRQQLGLVPGSRAVAYIDDGRLVIEDRRHLLTRLQDDIARRAGAAGAAGAEGGSAVDELLAERRAEAAAESAG